VTLNVSAWLTASVLKALAPRAKSVVTESALELLEKLRLMAVELWTSKLPKGRSKLENASAQKKEAQDLDQFHSQ